MGEEGSECKRCRAWEEEIYWNHFSSMHFFVILPKDFRHHVVLPAKFAENMMAKLPGKVSLKGPSATVWDIEVKKTDTVEFGGDGWKEFVKAYDLKDKNLLVFKYNQNSSFEVLIFDPENFCEKENSYFVKHCRHRKAENENGKKRSVAEAFSMEVIEDEDSAGEDHDDSEFVVHKKPRNDVSEESGRRKNPHTPRKSVLACASRGRGRPKRMIRSCESRKNLKVQSAAKELEKNGALDDVVEKEPIEKAVKEHSHVLEIEQNTSGNGGITLGTVHLHKSTEKKGKPKKQVTIKSLRKLVFPSGKEAEGDGLVRDVVEQEPEENVAAKGPNHVLQIELDTMKNGKTVMKTAHSRKSAVKKVGLRKKVPTVYSRKRALQSAEKYSKEYKSNRQPVSEIEKENTLKRAHQGSMSEKSFVSVMRPTAVYKRFYLSIPIEWMNKHLLSRNQQVVLRVGEKTWTTFFYHSGKKGGGLAGVGWKKFALENFLEEHDVCLFSLASQKHDPLTVMDVEIFRVVPGTVPPTPIPISPALK